MFHHEPRVGPLQVERQAARRATLQPRRDDEAGGQVGWLKHCLRQELAHADRVHGVFHHLRPPGPAPGHGLSFHHPSTRDRNEDPLHLGGSGKDDEPGSVHPGFLEYVPIAVQFRQPGEPTLPGNRLVVPTDRRSPVTATYEPLVHDAQVSRILQQANGLSHLGPVHVDSDESHARGGTLIDAVLKTG